LWDEEANISLSLCINSGCFNLIASKRTGVCIIHSEWRSIIL
jgi:hypothetical protein